MLATERGARPMGNPDLHFTEVRPSHVDPDQLDHVPPDHRRGLHRDQRPDLHPESQRNHQRRGLCRNTRNRNLLIF